MMIARTAAAVRRARAPTARAWSASCARATGSSARGCATWSPGTSSTSGPRRSSTPPGCGPTRSRRWSAAAGSSRSGRPRACTWWCRATGSTPRPGIITRTEKSLLFIIPWGSHWIIGTTDTDWKLDLAHPAASQHRHRLPARPRQLAAAGPAHPRGRRRGLRRPAAAAGRRVRLHQPALPRARRVQPGPGADRHRRRQVHDVPGHGQGRRRRRGPRHASARSRRSCTERIPLVGADGYLGAWNSRQLTAARTGLRRAAGRAPARPLRHADVRAARPHRRAAGAGRAAGRRARSTSRSRPATPPRTRARCTWRTCSPGGPASRSRSTTAATPRPRRWPTWSPRCSAGTTHDVAREVEHYRARVAGRAGVPAPARRPDRRRGAAGRTGRAGGGQRPGLSVSGVAALANWP